VYSYASADDDDNDLKSLEVTKDIDFMAFNPFCCEGIDYLLRICVGGCNIRRLEEGRIMCVCRSEHLEREKIQI
jgi:hypothetical protein